MKFLIEGVAIAFASELISIKSRVMEIQQTFTCSKSTMKILEKSEICLMLNMKTPERRHWRYSCVIIVNLEHISHLLQVCLLLTLNR